MRCRLLLLLFLLLIGAGPALAQRLLWERISGISGARRNQLLSLVLAPSGQQVMVGGFGYSLPDSGGPGCTYIHQAYSQLWNLNGALLHEAVGRRWLSPGPVLGLAAAPGGGYWWTSADSRCGQWQARSYLQRLSARGDTLRGWALAPSPPEHFGRVLLVQGARVLVAGDDGTPVSPGSRQFSLSCSDTSGTVLWRRLYPRPPAPAAYDYCTALAARPGGGYVLSGQAQLGNGTDIRHQVLLTDSLGRLQRRVLLQPLGPGFPKVNLTEGFNNLVVLPGGQGYALAGTADSLTGLQRVSVAYVVALDTAGAVRWVYRHPLNLPVGGQAPNPPVQAQRAFQLRLLPDSTLALLVRNERPQSPTIHLVQLDRQGRRRTQLDLTSPGYVTVRPVAWVWPGDGTLLLAGDAAATNTSNGVGYLARWDLRGTPLGAPAPGAHRASGIQLRVWPNPSPAGDDARLSVSGPVPAGAQVQLLALANGKVLRTLALTTTELALPLAGLPPGVYALRLLAQGRTLATTKLVVLP